MYKLGRVGRWQLKFAGCYKIYSFFLEGFPNETHCTFKGCNHIIFFSKDVNILYHLIHVIIVLKKYFLPRKGNYLLKALKRDIFHN